MLLYEDHQSIVFALAFSPDGGTLASGAQKGSLILRDADGKSQALAESGLKCPAIHAIAYLPDGTVVIGHARGWHIHRREGNAWKAEPPPSEAPTNSLAVIDADTLAVGTGDRAKRTAGNVELWDLRGLRRVEPHVGEPNGVRAVAACPAKRLVAWATGHREVFVWDIRRQDAHRFSQTSPQKDVRAVALAPDGSALAVAVDYDLKLYDVEKRRERRTLKGHGGRVEAVAFSPDGATLASGSWDQTVRLWDVRTGRERASFKWPIGRIYSLTYAPDGLRLAAGGDAGAVVVWDVE